MPCLPVDGNRHNGEGSRRQQLLALHQLRGNLERLARGKQKNASLSVAVISTELRRNLEELLAALDRRMPHVERPGEAAIAQAAETLRQDALRRLATLDAQSSRTSDGVADADDSRP